MKISAKTRVVTAVLLVCMAALIAAAYFYLRPSNPPPAVGRSGPLPSILSELPPGAPVISYIDVAALRKLQNSPLAAVLGLTSPGPKADREYADFLRDTGFDYTRDLDQAAIAFWPDALAPAPNPLNENRTVAIADGRFDQRKIKAYALRTGKVVPRGPRPVYEIPGNPPVAFEFLSSARIAIASGKNAAELAAAVRAHPADPELQSRIERVGHAPIFAVARTDRLPASFYSSLTNSPQLDHLARSIHTLTLAGEPQDDRIGMALDAQSDSIADALEISLLLDTGRMFASGALSQSSVLRQMTREQAAFLKEAVRRIKISRDGDWIRLSLGITPAMLGEPPAKALPRVAPARSR